MTPLSRRFLVLFGAISLLAAVPSGLAAVTKGSTLKLATEGVYPPFNFFEKGKLTGFEIELANAMVADMGLKPDWKTYPFDSLLIGLGEHKYDVVIASHGITEERAKAVDFSRPHYCSGGIIVSRTGGPKTVADLTGKVVAVEVGTTYLTKLQTMKGLGEIKTYPKDTDSLQNLIAGRADAWITDKFVALDMLKKYSQLQMGDMLFVERIGIAVAKGNKDLLAAINTSLEHVLANGQYAALSQKYFGQDIRCQ